MFQTGIVMAKSNISQKHSFCMSYIEVTDPESKSATFFRNHNDSAA